MTDPFQARQVVNEGKLAVIEGIEVSRIFGCGEVNDVPQCNQAQINAGLNEIQGSGYAPSSRSTSSTTRSAAPR